MIWFLRILEKLPEKKNEKLAVNEFKQQISTDKEVRNTTLTSQQFLERLLKALKLIAEEK